MNKITKAVFPVAGMGTRFLPATKASPKEMLPVVDKPLIQFAVEEAVEAGITEMIFVTGRNKRAIEDHFDKAYELETELELRGRERILQTVQDILPKGVTCMYIRQQQALGLGHAVLCAQPIVRDEPFAVILADDLIANSKPAMSQMVELFDETHCSILGVQQVARQETGQYGIVDAFTDAQGRLQINGLVEKPHPDVAPSTLGVVGRYILTPRVFHKLLNVQAGANGEIQLTDGIASLLAEERVFAMNLEGTRYDCGSKMGLLKATMAYGVQHREVGPAFRAFLTEQGLPASALDELSRDIFLQ